jgi:hypothetical protein
MGNIIKTNNKTEIGKIIDKYLEYNKKKDLVILMKLMQYLFMVLIIIII